MSETVILDVREIPPRIRHPKIFETFDDLGAGETFELVNDHDPKPLFYQFQHERPDQFKWEYREEGPEVWRVSIQKTSARAKTVVPAQTAQKPSPAKPEWRRNLDKGQEVFLDVRPFFKSGLEPFQTIMETVQALKEGQYLHLVNAFEPFPLYGVLAKKGFQYFAESQEDRWDIYFKKISEKDAGPPLQEEAGLPPEDLFDRAISRHPRVELDVRGLEPPEPLVRILGALHLIEPGGVLFIHHHREPVLLYDKLRERGFEGVTRKLGESDYKVLVWKKEK